jgi:hypothetical protein
MMFSKTKLNLNDLFLHRETLFRTKSIGIVRPLTLDSHNGIICANNTVVTHLSLPV